MESSSQITNNEPTSYSLQAGCPSCRPADSVKALKEKLLNGVLTGNCMCMLCRFFSDSKLEGMVPPSLVSIKSYNWTKCVLDQYKHYSRNLATRDRSLVV